jgi:hypothetical protein
VVIYNLTRHSHHLLSLSLEGKLHLAPLKDDIQVRALPFDMYNKCLTGDLESFGCWNGNWYVIKPLFRVHKLTESTGIWAM